MTIPRIRLEVVLLGLLGSSGAVHPAIAMTGAFAVMRFSSVALGAVEEPAADASPFFAMDTALRDGKERSAADQAALLKELGYDGVGTSGHPTDEFLRAFERAGLKVFNTYLTLDFDSAQPGLDPKLKQLIPRLKDQGTDLWIAIHGVTRDGAQLKPSDPSGDEVVVPPLRELAELAQANGIRIAFYPHTGFWLERVEDGCRLARAVDRPNVGTTFNLCHWLKVEGNRDPKPALIEALPRLLYVSINGADAGDTKQMDWNQLIQPLGTGSYDVAELLKSLVEIGYRGPIGFQGYGITGDSRQILGRTMQAWQQMRTRREGGYIFEHNERRPEEMAAARQKIPTVRVQLPTDRLRRLPRTMQRLRDGGTLRIVMLGDSIVNDTARSCWHELVEQQYPGCDIVRVVSVRGGTGCWFYKEPGRIDRYVVQQQPDLVIIGGISQNHDVDSIRDCVQQIRQKSDCEFLLMTGPYGAADPLTGEDWREQLQDGQEAAYAVRLKGLADEMNVEYFDMQAVWGEYIRGAGRPLVFFKRDPVHANAEGEAVLAMILRNILRQDRSTR